MRESKDIGWLSLLCHMLEITHIGLSYVQRDIPDIKDIGRLYVQQYLPDIQGYFGLLCDSEYVVRSITNHSEVYHKGQRPTRATIQQWMCAGRMHC